MPSLKLDTLLQLKEPYSRYKTFVETGTYLGETIFGLEPYFDHLYTVEIKKEYYTNLVLTYDKERKHKERKINFLLGDSTKIFPSLLPTLTQPTIFFLDGHWSSGETGRGEKDCPLLEELVAISTDFKPEGILIIDDYRLFGTKMNEDWSDITKENVFTILKDQIRDIYHLSSSLNKEDRLVIHLKAKSGGGQSASSLSGSVEGFSESTKTSP